MRQLSCCLLLLLIAVPGARAEAPFNFETTPGKLPKDVVPSAYKLDFTPNIEARTFAGRESVEVEVKRPVTRFVFNAQDLDIAATPQLTSLDGSGTPIKADLAFDAGHQTCTLGFPQPIPAGKYRLDLDFTGKINSDGGGLFASVYTGSDGKPQTMLCTQMEPTDARRLFPCWDEPSFRARFQINVHGTPLGSTAISNLPPKEEFTGTREDWAFQETPPMPTYLVVLAIGDFDSISGSSDGTLIRVVAPKGRVQNGRYALESAEKILHYYNDYFGVKFPLSKLDLIAVSGGGSFGGAMENWGGIVFAESALLYDPANSSQNNQERIFEVIAHEMAHQWFGDLVTMAWWDNLWLNEGFAEWMGEAATDHFNPDWQYWHTIATNRELAMASDALSTTHPIQQPVATEADAERAFDEITYQKGQSFIRMLEFYLSTDKEATGAHAGPFQDGLRAYMQAHAYGNSTTADLWQALDAATGQSISDVAKGWTEQPGFPVVGMTPVGDGKLKLAQSRFTMHDPQAAPLRWKIPLAEIGPIGSDAQLRTQSLFNADEALLAPVGDTWNLFNYWGSGYYRVQYDDATFKKVLDGFSELDRRDQSVILNDTWAEVRANRVPLSRFFALVQNLRPTETNPLVWVDACRIAGEIDALYVGGDPAARKAWREAMVAVLNPVWEHVGWEPGEKETAPDQELRAALVRLLGFFGDVLVIEPCQERFAAFLKDPTNLPPNLRAAVCDVVGRYADAKTYDALLAQARQAAGDEQKQLFYYALACANDPALARRTLELTTTDEIQGSFANRLIRAVATSGEHPAEALKFAQGSVAKLAAKISPMAKQFFLPNLYAAFNEAPRAEELEAYAKGPGVMADATQVRKSAELIRVGADLKTRLVPEVDRWAAGK